MLDSIQGGGGRIVVVRSKGITICARKRHGKLGKGRVLKLSRVGTYGWKLHGNWERKKDLNRPRDEDLC